MGHWDHLSPTNADLDKLTLDAKNLKSNSVTKLLFNYSNGILKSLNKPKEIAVDTGSRIFRLKLVPVDEGK